MASSTKNGRKQLPKQGYRCSECVSWENRMRFAKKKKFIIQLTTHVLKVHTCKKKQTKSNISQGNDGGNQLGIKHIVNRSIKQILPELSMNPWRR